MWQQLGAFDPVAKEELISRIEGLKALMAERGLDFAVIMQNVDLYYFTGTTQKGLLVIALDQEPLLFIEKSVTRAQSDSPLEVIPIKNNRDVRQILDEKKILHGKGGMELDVVPVKVFEQLKNILGFSDFVDVSPLIRELRMIKSPFELEQMRKAEAIFAQVYERGKEVIREGATEVEIDAELVAAGRRLGYQGRLRMRGFNMEMLNMCVFAGVTSGLPSAGDVPISGAGVTPAVPQGSSFLPVKRGIPVIVDYGSGYNGYITDESRVYVVGELQEIFRRPYEVAREIMEDAASFGKVGANTVEIFQRAYSLVKKAGLEANFMGHGEGQVSFIGHSLGLEINEMPVITAKHSWILKEGMTIAYEPKFTFPGVGAIGIEVTFVVRQDRLEPIGNVPVDIVFL